MTTELLLSLLGLALVDSLSAGTLLIPIFFLLAPGRIRAARILLYLATIAVFYFVVGVGLMFGASTLLDNATELLSSPVATIAQLLLGGALLAVGILMPTKSRQRVAGAPARGAGPEARQSTPSTAEAPSGRLARWRERALGDGAPSTVIVLALGAGLLELATMVPYLAAVGLLTGSGLDLPASLPILAAYCGVMIVPALLLLVARVSARAVVEPQLQRLSDWLSRNAAENTAWILAIVGFLLLRDALARAGTLEIWPFNG